MALEPSAAQLAALERDPDQGPVVMLNLLSFNERSRDGDGSGWDAYLRYSGGVIGLIKGCGGTVIWAGEATGIAIGEVADGYDYVAMVRYPSRRDFVAMMRSPDYAAINHHRINACARHVILALKQTHPAP